MIRLPHGIQVAGVVLFAIVATLGNAAGDATWPREIVTDKGTLTIYQPQPEKFDGNTLESRAAASFGTKG